MCLLVFDIISKSLFSAQVKITIHFFHSLETVLEVAYVTIGNTAFFLALYLTGVHFRGELQHVGYVGGHKFKCQPIRIQEIGGVRLQEELYVYEDYP